MNFFLFSVQSWFRAWRPDVILLVLLSFARCCVPRESLLWGSSAHNATRTAQNMKVTLKEWHLKLTLLALHQVFRPLTWWHCSTHEYCNLTKLSHDWTQNKFFYQYAKIWQDPFLNCSDSSTILWALEIYPNLHWITPHFRKNSNPSISEYTLIQIL